MTEILEILNSILNLSKDYKTKLVILKSDFETIPMSNVESMTIENQIKGQSYAIGLLGSYISNQIETISQFKTSWNTEQKVKYLINFDSQGLTNGKFYDYAVGHEMWQHKRPDIYSLIQKKIEEFCILERKLKLAFRQFVAKHYQQTIWFFPSSLLTIMKNELENGNEIIESSADEYFEYKIFFKFKYKFQTDYKDKLTDYDYKNLNDIKYWNEEYQDYFIVLTSGFEKK